MHGTARAILDPRGGDRVPRWCCRWTPWWPTDVRAPTRRPRQCPSPPSRADSDDAGRRPRERSPTSSQRRLPTWHTLVWNGPLGAFETPPFDTATVALAHAVADATEAGALCSVAGGGDTVAALRHAGVMERLTYVSSAGGAFLEWLEGKTLPGVAVLLAE